MPSTRVDHVTLPVPNPWSIAPICPHCRRNGRIFCWYPTGRLRWYCARCRRRFDQA